MKLLDLITDEVNEWPHSVGRMYQTKDGYIIVIEGWDSWYWSQPSKKAKRYPIVEDRDTALVTKAQWQAERDRRKNLFSVED